MKAIVARFIDGTVVHELEEVPEPSMEDGDLLVETIALGICGTDRHMSSRFVRLPIGSNSMVIGHESLGRVLQAPTSSDFKTGDLVVGIVRRPDMMPCEFCAAGEFDLCSNALYTERGIAGRHGFGSERFRLETSYAIKVDQELGITGVLLEPTSIVAKAWERLDRSISRNPARVVVFGAGPIGLLGAMLGIQRGHEVHVLDTVTTGRKIKLAQALGARYHTSTETLPGKFDVAVEATGALVGEAIRRTGSSGSVCLISIGALNSTAHIRLESLAQELVIQNKTITGIVNSNRRHFEAAHQALRRADKAWLEDLIDPQVALGEWRSAFKIKPEHVKAVILFADLD